MNTARLLQLADYLAGLPSDMFDLGVLVHCPEKPARLLTRLPDGSRAGPLGWLPAAWPDAWCWLGFEDGQVFPVFAGSSLWSPARFDFAEMRSDRWNLELRLWRQVGEWFEMEDVSSLDRLFSAEAYPDGYRGTAAVVNRLRSTTMQ
mgnify:CR=1 FL=1